MKIIYSTALIVLLVATVFMSPVKATDPTEVAGHVKDSSTGNYLSNIQLKLTETVSGQSVYTTTNGYGYYSKVFSSFTQGWSYGDCIKVFIVAAGYEQYFTRFTIAAGWGGQIILDISLIVIIQDQTVTNPYVDYTTQWQLNGGNSLLYTIVWEHATPAGIAIPNHNPAYDGVEIQGGMRVQDNGNWVPQGDTYRVYAQFSLKIERNSPSYHLYYDKTLDLYDNNNPPNMYYVITPGGNVLIDPMHAAFLPKGGNWPIDGNPLLETARLSFEVYDYTNPGNPQYLYTTIYSDTHTVTYSWS